MTDIDALIPAAKEFYGALNQNNTRAWWQDNRGPYDDILKPGAMALLDALAPHVSGLSGAEVKTKLFRPHRDVRFSKDKTPYNTHLHMMWMPQAGAPQNPVYFFGIGLDYVTAGAGLMGFEKPVLENWRKFADLDSERILGILEGLEKAGVAFREPELKRVPPPFPPDHPASEHLRRKGLIGSQDLGTPSDLVTSLKKAFTTLAPLNALLLQIAEA